MVNLRHAVVTRTKHCRRGRRALRLVLLRLDRFDEAGHQRVAPPAHGLMFLHIFRADIGRDPTAG